MKKFGIVIVVLAVCFAMIGLSASADVETQKISLNGSTSMEKMVNAIKDGVVYDYPELSLEPQFTGSSAGIEAAIDGTSDIGNSSRSLTDDEKNQGLVENIVAIDGIAIVTHADNEISNLTTDQLKQIYTGQITNWSQVGGPDQQIVVIGREAGSGTRGAFEEILGIEDQCNYAQELNETGAVMGRVAETEGAIGYVSFEAIQDDDTVKALTLDDVEISTDTIKDGSYTLQRPFVMATKGEVSEQSEQVQALFEFINSEAGQKIVESCGLVSPN